MVAYEGYKQTHVHGPWQRARVISWHAIRPHLKDEVPLNKLFALEIDEETDDAQPITVTPLSAEEKEKLKQLNGAKQ